MKASRSILSLLVIVPALGVAGSVSLGAAALGAIFASIAIAALAASDYFRQQRIFRAVRISSGEEPAVSNLRLAP